MTQRDSKINLFSALVDKTLELDDTDGDGFVSYSEYRAARERQPADRTPRVVADRIPRVVASSP